MFNLFSIIKTPTDYKLINLLTYKRLSNAVIEKTLNMSNKEIASHLNVLAQHSIISCDESSPLNMCRINQSFIEDNALFYQLMLSQAKKSIDYQKHLKTSNEFNNLI